MRMGNRQKALRKNVILSIHQTSYKTVCLLDSSTRIQATTKAKSSKQKTNPQFLDSITNEKNTQYHFRTNIKVLSKLKGKI